MLDKKLKSVIKDIPDFPKPGILFKDLTPILLHPDLSMEVIQYFVDELKNKKIDAMVGIESRGFLFGPGIAQRLNIPFVPIRKKGKLPGKTISYAYELEYGKSEMEMQSDYIKPNMNVLIHDDLLATGGTAHAAAEMIKLCNANVAGFTFLVELGFLKGKQKLRPYTNNIYTIISY